MYSDVAVIIPSRLGSTRLARKSLAQIGDKSLISHVVSKLVKLVKNGLYVATDSEEIAQEAEKAGATAIMTDEDCPSGSERVFQAFEKIPNHHKINYIINVQGDMPFVDPNAVNDIIKKLKTTDYDIVTPVVKVTADVAKNPSNVKVVVDLAGRAMYFSRSLVPYDATEFLYHVGIYGFKRDALEKFVNLEQSEYEKIEKLEQLRALEHGMKIGICFSSEIPISVDTQEDLNKAREYYSWISET
ncbi:MAG: 3-deoxy-manno-octulosonate cytidylyltransferase [Rickettsiales bacterium]|nr:MAG: 3-deoxy-manno-octulosonate cytidylyltransferase [Rickettsiales bacterium]